MGGFSSKPTAKLENQSTPSTTTTTTTPISHPHVTTAKCPEAYPIQNNLEYFILAFFAGVLLTLLLLALVFLTLKSYRKCHSHTRVLEPQLDPYLESPAKPSSSQEAITYADMSFTISGVKRPFLTTDPSAGLDSVIYSQVKEKNSPLSSQ